MLDWVKRNPVPAALAGAGILTAVFLLAGGSQAQQDQELLEGLESGAFDVETGEGDDFDFGDAFVPISSPSTSSVTGSQLVTSCEKYLNLPYQRGGIGAPWCQGMDCSGIIWRGAHDLGVKIPRTANNQYNAMSQVLTEEQARNTPGAFVWMPKKSNPSVMGHVELSTGSGQTIAAWVGGTRKAPWGWWKKSKSYQGLPFYYGMLPQFS